MQLHSSISTTEQLQCTQRLMIDRTLLLLPLLLLLLLFSFLLLLHLRVRKLSQSKDNKFNLCGAPPSATAAASLLLLLLQLLLQLSSPSGPYAYIIQHYGPK